MPAKKKNLVETPDAAMPDPIAEGGEVVHLEEGETIVHIDETVDAAVTADAAMPADEDGPIAIELIPSLRFTDGLYVYQLDETKRGVYWLRPVGVVQDAA